MVDTMQSSGGARVDLRVRMLALESAGSADFFLKAGRQT